MSKRIVLIAILAGACVIVRAEKITPGDFNILAKITAAHGGSAQTGSYTPPVCKATGPTTFKCEPGANSISKSENYWDMTAKIGNIIYTIRGTLLTLGEYNVRFIEHKHVKFVEVLHKNKKDRLVADRYEIVGVEDAGSK